MSTILWQSFVSISYAQPIFGAIKIHSHKINRQKLLSIYSLHFISSNRKYFVASIRSAQCDHSTFRDESKRDYFPSFSPYSCAKIDFIERWMETSDAHVTHNCNFLFLFCSRYFVWVFQWFHICQFRVNHSNYFRISSFIQKGMNGNNKRPKWTVLFRSFYIFCWWFSQRLKCVLKCLYLCIKIRKWWNTDTAIGVRRDYAQQRWKAKKRMFKRYLVRFTCVRKSHSTKRTNGEKEPEGKNRLPLNQCILT